MATIQKFDLTREQINLQRFADEVRQLINNGNFEVEVTNASEPAFDAPQETKFVLSIFGAQFRLYISYLGDWYYATLTKLP
jgi:hypothetical protein